jgi:hypothetical protein
MFQHQGAIIREFLSNKGLYVQQLFHLFFYSGSKTWMSLDDIKQLFHINILQALTYLSPYKIPFIST